jgi:MraZ protein
VSLSGQSEHGIDSKLRLAIPARLRPPVNPDGPPAAYKCVPWPSGHLRLYPEEVFRVLSGEIKSTLTSGESISEFERTMFGMAEKLELDASGRVALHKYHIELVGLGSEVVVVGANNRLEVHDRAKWKSELLARFNKLPELAERAERGRLESKG